MRVPRYTIDEFHKRFPDDSSCLDFIFQQRFGHLEYCPKCGVQTKFYRIKTRKYYKCPHCAFELYPLANTIFHKSATPLTKWFYGVYLFGVSKNGVSAMELERMLGVTYKTAWRMAKQIRQLMEQNTEKLTGIVEADETYIGGRRTQRTMHDNKTPVVGVTEKHGQMKAKALDRKASDSNVMPFLLKNVEPLSVLHTDKSLIYRNAMKDGFKHRSVDHGVGHYVHNGIHTNNIEGFWGQLKRSISGTYHSVGPKYLQLYVDEFVYRYNYRHVSVFPTLMARVSKRVQ